MLTESCVQPSRFSSIRLGNSTAQVTTLPLESATSTINENVGVRPVELRNDAFQRDRLFFVVCRGHRVMRERGHAQRRGQTQAAEKFDLHVL